MQTTGSEMQCRGSAAGFLPAWSSNFVTFIGRDSLHTPLALLRSALNAHTHTPNTQTHTHTLLTHTLLTHTHDLILVDVEEFGHFVQICVFLSVFDDLEGRQKHVKSR